MACVNQESLEGIILNGHQGACAKHDARTDSRKSSDKSGLENLEHQEVSKLPLDFRLFLAKLFTANLRTSL